MITITKTKFTLKLWFHDGTGWKRVPNIHGMKDCQTLDETLDFSKVNIGISDRSEPFEPFTKIKIELGQEREGVIKNFYIYRYVAYDICKQIAWYNNEIRWQHDLNLIEPSKILEREVVDNLAFTKTLTSKYVLGKVVEENFELKKNHDENNMLTKEVFDSYYNTDLRYVDKYVLNSELMVLDYVIERNGGYQEYAVIKLMKNDDVIWNGTYGESVGQKIILNELGSYKITYSHTTTVTTGFGSSEMVGRIVSFPFEVVNNDVVKKQQTFSNAIDRLLAVTPLRKATEPIKYKLSDEARAKYGDIVIPDIYITGNHLWEALTAIGGFIHAIPYLRVDDNYPNWDTIDFLELGGETAYSLRDRYSAKEENWYIDQYCTNIDSTVENIMNTDSQMQGTVTEPYNGGWQTVRSSGVEVSEDTMVIQTNSPIEKVVKLEMKYKDAVLDFTPFIYENAEYETLSAYYNSYPSKAYALRFTQGQQNIDCLQFKIKDAVDQAFVNPVYKNIISMLTGDSISSMSGLTMNDMLFRVTYIPHTTMRVKQYKTNALDFATDSTLIYNQQARKVDSEAYGENLKGVVTRLGNKEKVLTYIFAVYDAVPQVGSITEDGYYVAKTESVFFSTQVKCTITLTKDYNKLSEYIGLSSEIRYYEVSEKMSVERYLNRSEFAVIGDEINGSNCITAFGAEAIRQTFVQDEDLKSAGGVNLVAYDKDNQVLSRVTLPATSLAIGNSIAVQTRYEDNYSAGNQIGEIKTVGNSYKKVKSPLRYTDIWGNVEYLDMQIGHNFGYITSIGSIPETSYTTGDMENITRYKATLPSEYKNISNGQAWWLMTQGYTADNIAKLIITSDSDAGNKLPNAVSSNVSYFDTLRDKLVVKKDSRECLNLTYQLHFITNRNDIVIGSALNQYNSIVSGSNMAKKAKLVLLDREIGRFEKVVTGAEMSVVMSNFIVCSNGKIKINGITANSSCKAWALVTSDRNELLLGVNEPLEIGESSKEIFISFTSKIN